jgi:hypothetical protein
MNNFYETVGYVVAYSNYVILFFFVIKPKKITLSPFNFLFINIVISVLLDAVSLYLHDLQLKSIPALYKLITSFYAVNNILFLGLFLSYFMNINKRKSVQILSFLLSTAIIFLYYFDNKTNFSTWGTLTQILILLIFLLTAIRDLNLSAKRQSNNRPAFIIIISFIIGYLLTFIVYLYFNVTKEIEPDYANLIYGIQNIFWIVVNLLIAYAVYKIVPKPTSSPKPSPPLPKLN